MDWAKFFYVILALLIAWLLFRNIRGNKEWFNKANISKSFGTMGILALILIVFIGFCVLLLRQS